MIKERYLHTGIREDNGKRVTGSYLADFGGDSWIVNTEKMPESKGEAQNVWAKVKPETVEPVSVPPAVKGYEAFCPNCGKHIASVRYIREICAEHPYCQYCGQRLGWSDEGGEGDA